MSDRGRPTKRYSQAARLHDLIRLLESRSGLTVGEMVEATGVTRRTLYRDLQAIGEAGYPLIRDRGEGGEALYRFISGFKSIPPITFSLEELMSLQLGRAQLAFLKGTVFLDQIDAVLARIHAGLPPRAVAHLDRITRAAAPRFLGAHNHEAQQKELGLLQRALLFQYRCTLRYAPVDKPVADYEVEPYSLLFYRDSLYLIARALNRGEFRTFLVERIRSVSLSERRFEIPESFDPEAVTGEGFGLVDEPAQDICLEFASEVAHQVRGRQWHGSQVLEELPGGAVRLSFRAGGRREILSWAASFLPFVRVVTPADLREAFLAMLQRGAVFAASGETPPQKGETL